MSKYLSVIIAILAAFVVWYGGGKSLLEKALKTKEEILIEQTKEEILIKQIVEPEHCHGGPEIFFEEPVVIEEIPKIEPPKKEVVKRPPPRVVSPPK